MTATDVLILCGTVSLSLLAVFTYFIASTNGYRRYGREALLVAVFVYAMLVAVRLSRDELGLLTPTQAVQFASAGYMTALLILAQIAFILRRARIR